MTDLSSPSRRLQGRVALVTGAGRGIGAAVACAYADEGAHVVLLARTAAELEAVDDSIRARGGVATLLPLDLAKPEAVAALAPALLERFRRLDILVANAGTLGPLSPVALSDPKGWDAVMKVNFLANFHLIRALDPLLRGSAAGRAIFVTSGIVRHPSPFWGAYAASKAALEAMVTAYAAEVAYSALRVNILDPGVVRTAMRAEAFPAEDPDALPDPSTLSETFITLALPECTRHGQVVEAA